MTISNTKLSKRIPRKMDSYIVDTIILAKKSKKWRDVAQIVSGSRRKYSSINLGRLASHAAKQALLGKEVSVINCEKTVISGNRRVVIQGYKEIRSKGGSSLKGPIFPTQPAQMVKRTIRGMLSHKDGRGALALK